MAAHDPIGLFDSGVGGLSIMKEVRRLLPQEDLIYVADSKFCLMGKDPAAIRDGPGRSRRLITQGVVNSWRAIRLVASKELRANFPYPSSGWNRQSNRQPDEETEYLCFGTGLTCR